MVNIPLHIAALLGQTCFYLYQVFKKRISNSSRACIDSFKLPVDPTFVFLRETKGILSGSAVLAMLDPQLVDAADLDIYMPRGSMEKAHHFLMGCSFRLVEREVTHDTTDRTTKRQSTGIHEVRYYVHTAHRTIVNVIETVTQSTPCAIFLFHSTVVMNYMTWNSIVCAYPITTGLRRGLVNSYLPYEGGRMLRCLGKYRRRGYQFISSPLECPDLDSEHDCGDYAYCALTARHVRDRATMRITLGDDPFEEADIVDDETSWQLACKVAECGATHYNPSAGWVESGDGDLTEISTDVFEEYV